MSDWDPFGDESGVEQENEPHPEQVVAAGDPELPRDVVEAAGRRLENEPLHEEVVTQEDPDDEFLREEAALNDAFAVGYDLKPCPDEWRAPGMSPLCVAWAKGVWERQGELMREANEPAWKLKQRAEMKKKGSSWD